MAGVETLIFGLLLIVITPGIQASCAAGRFGESCRYSCNCQDLCDQVTGTCPGSCSAGWVKGGQLCQKENIAYKKTATSTTNTRFPDWPPRNAVDGNNDINGKQSTCFHGDSGKNELTIDLGDHYKLYHIRFYLRSASNSLIYLDGVRSKVCYTFPPSVRNNPTDVVCDAEARFLTIENPGTGALIDTYLNICEIEIYRCSSGTFGENCNFFCHCSSCDVTTGVCPGDCFAGWMGERCDIACDSTSYGINCLHECHCAPGSSCNRFTGRCDTGCLPGWQGEHCMKECDPGYYGQNCSKVCADRNCYGTTSCDHVTGSCEGGCGHGWRGTDCRQECADSYGMNCNLTCGDRKCAGEMMACDRFIGACDPCLPDWQGVDCTEKVPDVADSSESTTTDVRTIALSTTVGVLVVIIAILTFVIFRNKLMRHSSDKTSAGDNTNVPGHSPTPDHIYTELASSNIATAPATNEPCKANKDNLA